MKISQSRTPAFYDSYSVGAEAQGAVSSISYDDWGGIAYGAASKTWIHFRHDKRANIAFWDGHAAGMDPGAVRNDPLNNGENSGKLFASNNAAVGEIRYLAWAYYFDSNNEQKMFKDL